MMAEIDCNSYLLYKSPSNAIIANRKAFYGLKRRNGECIQTWFERVRSHINHCKFPKIMEFLLIDKFMCGLNSDEMESIRCVDIWSFRKLREYLRDEAFIDGQTNTNVNIEFNQNIDPAEQIPATIVKCELVSEIMSNILNFFHECI